jgi:hypothetical protein
LYGRIARYVIGAGIAWAVFTVQGLLVYLGLLAYALVADVGTGGPLAGPLLVLVAAVLGAVLVPLLFLPSVALGEAAGRRGQPLRGPAGQPLGGAPSPSFGSAAAQPLGDAAAQPLGDAAAQPLGDAAAQPLGDAAAQPLGGAAGRPFGDAAAQPLGGAAGRPFGGAAGRPFGGAAGRPFGGAAGWSRGVAVCLAVTSGAAALLAAVYVAIVSAATDVTVTDALLAWLVGLLALPAPLSAYAAVVYGGRAIWRRLFPPRGPASPQPGGMPVSGAGRR